MKVQYQTDCNNRVTQAPQKKKQFQYNTKQPEINVLQNYESQSNKIESIPGHIRSKSYEHDYFTKALNTFGINADQSQLQPLKTKRQHSISQKENDPGFLSPKFRFESCDTVVTRKSQNSVINELQECVDLSKVTELSMQSQTSPCKVYSEFQQKIEAKDSLIDELQKQLTSTLKNMTQQIDLLRNEKNKIIQQQVRQIEIYEQQLQECRQEIQSKNKELMSLKKSQKDIRKITDIRQEKHLINSIPQNFISKKECSCQQLERENKALLAKVDQFRQQLHELKQNLEFNNLSINNQISVIEKCDLTQFEKTFKQLADELNLTIDSKNINSSFSLLNQEVIEGVKSLKQQFKENEKFIRCLKDLVIQCAPQDYFCQSDPSLKEVWKFIKQILQSYLEHKKQAQLNEDLVFTLCKYFRCNKGELNHKGACLVVDQEVYLRIVDKIKRILNLTNLNNIRELDRKLDYYLQ
ncbi:unnamed protein product (macronuclear) [Paramecium tetraurelia]|uniref:Centrosomal protein of 70 kDa n=1 Tax=Paramecium tetraurelia TaxID=5888 RepID=A0BUM0_PARTE|nr:uncharacterized protein GSPATT00005483001 [Paramecium tetraurelia]CAK62237.1 unnamed protein product [Paramecium tetraurelia]|eukprot:XP_001429635.1 hypothetical protein (macronuclear) [Paramecium tetraurelia strain d4-2]